MIVQITTGGYLTKSTLSPIGECREYLLCSAERMSDPLFKMKRTAARRMASQPFREVQILIRCYIFKT